MMDDRETMNFSEEHELNHQLKKAKKAQSEKNRETLKKLGKELKEKINAHILTNDQFHTYVLSQLDRLDN